MNSFSTPGVGIEKYLMARKLLDKLPDHHELDLHFLHASRAWRQNKKEVFGQAGSSGSFEYVDIQRVYSILFSGILE
jgi:hypothetical protein